MPKRMYVLESPVIFDALLEEVNAAKKDGEPDFQVVTPNPTPESFAATLIDQHYPPQSELPLH